MTRDEAKKLLPLIQQFADGAEIEVRQCGGDWMVYSDPVFNSAPDSYRIKPSPEGKPFDQESWSALGPVVWLRKLGYEDFHRIVDMIDSCRVNYIPYLQLARDWEYSTDLKTWYTCVRYPAQDH